MKTKTIQDFLAEESATPTNVTGDKVSTDVPVKNDKKKPMKRKEDDEESEEEKDD